VNSGDTPLAFYAFTKNQAFAQDLVQRIPFGGGCVNDTIAQLANLSLPFGGQGNSGMGAYHGKAGFEAFSRKKPVVHRSFSLDVPVKYPPYSESKLGWIRRLLKFA
jgi:aldehyde dehydrogenase (NAD+)